MRLLNAFLSKSRPVVGHADFLPVSLVGAALLGMMELLEARNEQMQPWLRFFMRAIRI